MSLVEIIPDDQTPSSHIKIFQYEISGGAPLTMRIILELPDEPSNHTLNIINKLSELRRKPIESIPPFLEIEGVNSADLPELLKEIVLLPDENTQVGLTFTNSLAIYELVDWAMYNSKTPPLSVNPQYLTNIGIYAAHAQHLQKEGHLKEASHLSDIHRRASRLLTTLLKLQPQNLNESNELEECLKELVRYSPEWLLPYAQLYTPESWENLELVLGFALPEEEKNISLLDRISDLLTERLEKRDDPTSRSFFLMDMLKVSNHTGLRYSDSEKNLIFRSVVNLLEKRLDLIEEDYVNILQYFANLFLGSSSAAKKDIKLISTGSYATRDVARALIKLVKHAERNNLFLDISNDEKEWLANKMDLCAGGALVILETAKERYRNYPYHAKWDDLEPIEELYILLDKLFVKLSS